MLVHLVSILERVDGNLFHAMSIKPLKVPLSVQSLISFYRNTQARDGGRGSSMLKPEAETPLETSVIGSAVSAPVQELTVEDMEKRSVAIIEEYLYIKDMAVCFCFRDH